MSAIVRTTDWYRARPDRATLACWLADRFPRTGPLPVGIKMIIDHGALSPAQEAAARLAMGRAKGVAKRNAL